MPSGLDQGSDSCSHVRDALLPKAVTGILDNISCERLPLDPRLSRMQHPLIQGRVDAMAALNMEIYTLVRQITHSVNVPARERAEAILFKNVLDPEACGQNIQAFKDAVTALELRGYSSQDTSFVVDAHLRSTLTMPTLAQELVLYYTFAKPITGQRPEDALVRLENVRNGTLGRLQLSFPSSDGNVQFDQFSAEFDAVRSWLLSQIQEVSVESSIGF